MLYHLFPAALRAIARNSPRLLSQCGPPIVRLTLCDFLNSSMVIRLRPKGYFIKYTFWLIKSRGKILSRQSNPSGSVIVSFCTSFRHATCFGLRPANTLHYRSLCLYLECIRREVFVYAVHIARLGIPSFALRSSNFCSKSLSLKSNSEQKSEHERIALVAHYKRVTRANRSKTLQPCQSD